VLTIDASQNLVDTNVLDHRPPDLQRLRCVRLGLDEICPFGDELGDLQGQGLCPVHVELTFQGLDLCVQVGISVLRVEAVRRATLEAAAGLVLVRRQPLGDRRVGRRKTQGKLVDARSLPCTDVHTRLRIEAECPPLRAFVRYRLCRLLSALLSGGQYTPSILS